MGLETIVAAVSVLGNLFLGFYGLFKKAQHKKVSEQLGVVSEGLNKVSDVVETLKTSPIAQTPAGKQVTAGIKAYGPVVQALVTQARNIAHDVEDARD